MNKRKAPEVLESIVKRWLKQSGLNSGWKKYKIFATWQQLSDQKIIKHTKAKGFKNNVLVVEVDSPIYYFELVNFYKEKLLKELQSLTPEVYIKNIRFVCSAINE